jgi:DNA-binding IclR family transcriptional regulator
LVPAVENAVAIVEYLNSTPPHTASLAELARALSISRSHCHSILKTLTHFEWLRYDERSKTYELHIGLICSASSVLRSPLLDRIRPLLVGLANKVRYPCVMTQPLADASYVLVEKFEGSESMAVWYPVTSFRVPCNASRWRRYD